MTSRVSIIEAPHWSAPIRALSEETVALQPGRAHERAGAAIRHAVSETDYQRLMAGMGCHQCLTPFPAPVGLDIANLAKWHNVTSTEFRWTHTREHGLDLVKQGCCPVCGYECSPEMFAVADEGRVDGGAPETPAMQYELDGFADRAEKWFKENEASKPHRAGSRRKKQT